MTVTAYPESPTPPGRTSVPSVPMADAPALLEASRRVPVVRVHLRRWAGRVACGAVLLASVEATCRIDDLILYGTPVWSRYTSQSDLLAMNGSRTGGGWIHGRPHARFQKWVLNGFGMRGPEVGAVAPPQVVRVVTVGASETFGLTESPNHEFPRQLEDSLNAHAAGACGAATTRRYQILNAAMPGMSLPTIRRDLQVRVAALRPGIVVFYPSPAQYLANQAPGQTLETPQVGVDIPWTRALHPRAIARLAHQVKPAVPTALLSWADERAVRAERAAHPKGWYFAGLPTERVRLFDTDLRRMIGTIKAIGAEPLLATHANVFTTRDGRGRAAVLQAWGRYYPRATGAMLVQFDSIGRELVLQAARDSNVRVVDASSNLAGMGATSFSDFAHFTDLGSARMAGLLAPAVRAATNARSNCGR